MRRRWDQGDTIIEVLSAVVVFSLLAIGVISIMNQGINGAQRALEITLVRQQMDAQAEVLRYINQGYLAGLSDSGKIDDNLSTQWRAIQAKAETTTSISPHADDTSQCPAIPSQAFIMDAKQQELSSAHIYSMTESFDGSTLTPPPYARVVYNDFNLDRSFGIWIEAAAAPEQAGIRHIDFYIRSCWQGPGTGTTVNLDTIVRLYDTAS